MDDFISDDDLQTFEGFLKYQVPDLSTISPEKRQALRDWFDEDMQRRATSPKVGLMKFSELVPGEQRYAVANRDGSDLCPVTPSAAIPTETATRIQTCRPCMRVTSLSNAPYIEEDRSED